MPLYTSTGALNVVSNDTNKGRYTSTGALRINLVSGTSYVGLYAADGALNVVDVSGTSISTYIGLYHPSGAIRGRAAPNTYSGLQAPDGSYYFDGLFSPFNLFLSGEQGVWYDPSDFSTMFQDAAGTTPVTAVEQPVGLILDKSGRGNHASQSTTTARPVLSARVNLLVNTNALSSQSVTTIATNYTLAFSGTGSITLSGTATGTYSAGSNTITCTAGTLTLTVSGSVTNADLRVTNAGVNLPAYQRVTTSTDYDTTGFPLYLRFDGTDDSLATASIDFSVTDKVSVFAGIRKLRDTLTGDVVELTISSTVNNGTFLLAAPGSAAPNFFWRSKGTVNASSSTASSYPSPLTAVLTGVGDIANDIAKLRYNGTVVLDITTDQGTGAFSNAALYIGSRGNNLFFFNGNLYSLIVRGAQSSDEQIASAEAWTNTKTRAY